MSHEETQVRHSAPPRVGVYSCYPLLAVAVAGHISSSRRSYEVEPLLETDDVGFFLDQSPESAVLVALAAYGDDRWLAPILRESSPLRKLIWISQSSPDCQSLEGLPLTHLAKSIQPDEFLTEIDSAVRGLPSSYIPGTCQGEPEEQSQTENGHPRGLMGSTALTRREREVLTLVAMGHSVKECAGVLGIAESTVDNHKMRLMRKTGARKSTELVRLAIRLNLVDV